MIPDHKTSRLIVLTLASCQAALTPLAFVYFIYYILVSQTSPLLTGDNHGGYYTLPTIIHYWLAAEILFYGFFHITQRRMQYATSPNTLTSEDRKVLVSHCISNVDDSRQWLCGWFVKDTPGHSMTTTPDFEEIYLDNVIEWYVKQHKGYSQPLTVSVRSSSLD
jgi:hypothetical protein